MGLMRMVRALSVHLFDDCADDYGNLGSSELRQDAPLFWGARNWCLLPARYSALENDAISTVARDAARGADSIAARKRYAGMQACRHFLGRDWRDQQEGEEGEHDQSHEEIPLWQFHRPPHACRGVVRLGITFLTGKIGDREKF